MNINSKPSPRFLKRINTLTVCCLIATSSFAQGTQEVVLDYKELPKAEWIFQTGQPIYASPIVSDNLVYFGGLDSLLHAVDITSGKEVWQFRINGEIRSDVCINQGQLFLNGGDGFLYALDKKDGRVLWKYGTNGERKYDFADYFHSTPIVNQQIVYFGSGDGNMYAVHTITGSLVWKFQTGSVVHCKPAISNSKIFISSFDGYVYAIDIANGVLVWKFKTVGHRYFPKGEVQGSPSVYRNLVIVGARDYNMYALDGEKGFCHWNKAFTKGWGLSNNLHDSILYIGSADERVLIAAEPETGKEFWRKNMEFLVFGNNAYSENMLYLGTTIGKLHGIQFDSGEKSWSFETGTYQKNRYLYFNNDDSYREDIYSIIHSNEEFLEVEVKLGGIFSTPYISNDYILFTSTNGNLYCLKR